MRSASQTGQVEAKISSSHALQPPVSTRKTWTERRMSSRRAFLSFSALSLSVGNDGRGEMPQGVLEAHPATSWRVIVRCPLAATFGTSS